MTVVKIQPKSSPFSPFSDDDDDTQSFEEAIAIIERNGGGRLIVSPGDYLIRPINLTSHMTLLITQGATIHAVEDPDKWNVIPPLPSYGQGRGMKIPHHPRYTSLIHGEHLENVTILGQGKESIINGHGQNWWINHRAGKDKYTRPQMIEFMYTKDLKLYNFQIKDSPFWTNHFYDCDNVHVKHLYIDQPEDSPNTDGFDPDSSRNVLIEDSYYHGGDDCVAVKSGWDCFGIEYNKPCVNITVRNITCHGQFAGIAIGSEMSGGIDNVTIENVHFTKANKPGNIKVGNMRGGYVKNIVYQDILVEGEIQEGIHIDMFHYNDSPNPSCDKDWRPSHLPYISDIYFQRIDGRNAIVTGNETFHLWGYDEQPVTYLYFDDVHFPEPSSGGVAWNCTGIQGTTKKGGVSPWPPCPEVGIVDNHLRETMKGLKLWTRQVMLLNDYYCYVIAVAGLLLYSIVRRHRK